MISRLTGKLIEKTPSSIILETGGIGFEVLISSRTYEKLSKEGSIVSLNIHTHVREEEIKLVGFFSNDEKELFLKILVVSGISVKIALSSLSIYSVDELKSIIIKNEADLLRRVPGIGKKLAERMIVELRDKFEESGYAGIFVRDEKNKNVAEAMQALKTLGYSAGEINEVLKKIKVEDLIKKPTEEILKLALKEM